MDVYPPELGGTPKKIDTLAHAENLEHDDEFGDEDDEKEMMI